MAQLASLPAVEPAEVTKRLADAGVPFRFQPKRLHTFEPRPGTQKALEAARRVAEKPHGLILVGPPGTGKTHLTVGILAERVSRYLKAFPVEHEIRDGMSVMRPALRLAFLGVPRMLDILRYRIGREEPDPLPEWSRADLLVLDDIGREKVTDWALERLYVLVNERYEAGLPTVVTSNLTLNQLHASGHDATISRLTEDAEVVKLTASDRRSER